MEFRIADPDTGEICANGTPGELQVRGIWVMDRFYKRLRSDTFTVDGFYPTGDRCTMDGENRIWFHHRLGGMIKTSGANVSPEERSEEHTSELQSLMRISYAVFCLKKKTKSTTTITHDDNK